MNINTKFSILFLGKKDDDLSDRMRSIDECLITIGQIGTPKRRFEILKLLIELNIQPATID
jgi:hypothetical protein